MWFKRLAQVLILLVGFCSSAFAQGYKSEIEAPEKVSLVVKNLDGRVSVIASEEQQKKVTIEAKSIGAAVAPEDVKVESKGSDIHIDVRPRGEKDRIDLVVTIPTRSKVQVEGQAGSVDVIGSVESAVVKTDTGTIHADVPLDALKFKFAWESSRPRFMSDVELPRVKEGRAGAFSISGELGPDVKRKKEKKKKEKTSEPGETADGQTDGKEGADKNADGSDQAAAEKPPEKQQLVHLNFTTQRGVILLNIDPSMAPNDLRERPLTEAAKAIVVKFVSYVMKNHPKDQLATKIKITGTVDNPEADVWSAVGSFLKNWLIKAIPHGLEKK